MCATGILSPSTVHSGLDWAGPGQLADPLVLNSQAASAKHLSQCLSVPALSAHGVVCNQSIVSFLFPRGWCMVGDAIHSLSAMPAGPVVSEVVSETSPIV